jgi:hypothetical protein
LLTCLNSFLGVLGSVQIIGNVYLNVPFKNVI